MAKKREKITLMQDFYVDYERDEDRAYVISRLREAMSEIGIYGGGEFDYTGEAMGRATETQAAPIRRRPTRNA